MRKSTILAPLCGVAFLAFIFGCFYIMGENDGLIQRDTPVAHADTPCYSATLYESGREVIVQKSHKGC